MTILKKLQSLKWFPTVEVLNFLIRLATGAYVGIMTPLVYYKICVHTIHDQPVLLNTANITDCSDLGGNKEFENYVQRTAAVVMLKTRLATLPIIPCNILLSAWGDIHGRKTVILIGLVGEGMKMFGFLVATAYVMTPFWILYIFCFISSLSGYQPTNSGTNITAYLSDRIANRDKVLCRLIVNGLLEALGGAIGSLIASKLVIYFNMATIMCLVLGIIFICVIYVASVFEQNPPRSYGAHEDATQSSKTSISPNRSEQNLEYTNTSQNCIRNLTGTSRYNPIQVIKGLCLETYTALTRQRESHDKRYLYLTIAASVLYATTEKGLDLQYVYVMRQPRSFTAQLVSLDLSVRAFSQCFGGLVAACILLKFNINTVLITMISLFGCIVSLLTLALAETVTIVFLSSGLCVLNNIAFHSLDAFICNLVSPSELGKLMSIIGVGRALANFVGTGIYNPFYSATLDIWDGSVFVLISGVVILALLCVSYIFVDSTIITKRSDNIFGTEAIDEDDDERKPLVGKL